MKNIVFTSLIIISGCKSLNIVEEPPDDNFVRHEDSKFYISNSDENIDMLYNSCEEKSKRMTKTENVISKGTGGVVLLSGITFIASGFASAVAAVPAALGMMAVGGTTISAANISNEYRGNIKIQNCLEEFGYKVILINE